MSWAGAIAALDANLETACGVLNTAYPNLEPFTAKPGEPFSALHRQVRYWYEGDQEARNTLNAENVEEKVTIRWYWPVLNRDDSWISDLEVQIQAANRATHSALLGDAHLGENCIALRIDDTSTGWQQVGTDAWLRVLTIPIRIEMVDVATIAN